MAGRAAAFAVQIDRELAATDEEFRLIVRSLALQALSRIVQRTPVDTGRARGNWTVSIGAADGSVTANLDPGGAGAIADGNAVLAQFENYEGFPSIFIQNNLPYIERLEDGYSSQAPGGMVALTVAELRAQVS